MARGPYLDIPGDVIRMEDALRDYNSRSTGPDGGADSGGVLPPDEREGRGRRLTPGQVARLGRQPDLSPIGFALGGAGIGLVVAGFLGQSMVLGAVLGGVGGYAYGSYGGKP